MMVEPLLRLENVSKRFSKKIDLAGKIAGRLGAKVSEQTVHAVDDVSIDVNEGEVVGLVGESGCGKSTLGRVAAGIHSASEGSVYWRGRAIEKGKRPALRDRMRIQMVFQDPMSSINPRHRIDRVIGEAPAYHKLVPGKELDGYVCELLDKVGLDPSYRTRYPHQFSGGQRQRIAIARALAVRPELIVCDEAVSALDVSVQAQVLNLFMSLRKELGLAYLFISHDLSVVEHVSDRVVIMYLGRVVESAATPDLYARPLHPYSQALLNEVPRLTTGKRVFQPVKGEIPSPLDPPPGCHFHPRCPLADDHCKKVSPALREVAPGRKVACHKVD